MNPRFSRLACFSLTLLGTTLTAPGMAANRGFTVEDLVAMERIGSPVLAPDGMHVVYTVRSTDLDKNRARTDLYRINLLDPKATSFKLTNAGSAAEGNNTDPVWSASGDAIYFISTRSGSAQVWRLPLSGVAAKKVSDFPVPVESFRVAPDGHRIAVSLEVFPDCPDLACTKARLDKKAHNKATGMLFDKLLYRHWNTWSDGRRAVLFSALLDANHSVTGAPVSLSGSLDADVHSHPFGDQDDYAFSPDSKSVVFSAKVAGKAEAWSTNFDLYRVAAQGGMAPENLTPDNPAWDAKPVFSPDGKTLAYLAMKRPGFESDRFQIMLMDIQSGKKHLLAENWDRSPERLRWSDDGKTLYTNTRDLGQIRLFGIDVASGTVSAVSPISDQGSVAEFDIRGQSAVLAQSSMRSGTQLFHRSPGAAGQPNWRQITHVNESAQANVQFAAFQQFNFVGAKGEKVYGYVMQPWQAKAGEKYPVALLIHGGPQGSFTNNWGYRINPQVLAGAGYAVVMMDIHGSQGYGQAFTDSVSQDWGGKPFIDLKLGMAAAAKQFPALDQDNACAIGWSYGGFMINWIAGNWPDGFKCLVNHAGIFDFRSMYYSTDEQWFNEWENGGTYYDVPAKHEKFNPVNHVKKWKTPMLLTHGGQDFRVPDTQSFSTFTALQRRGIESKLLVIPDEGHIFNKPANALLWNHTILDWLGKYLK